MSLFVQGRLLSVITYDSDKPLTTYPEFLEACKKYDIIQFIDKEYEHPIDCLPDNIKYICLTRTQFNLPLNNLPSGLIGISLPDVYNCPLHNLPHGIKYIHVDNLIVNNQNLPSTIELISTGNGRFDKEGKSINIYEKYEKTNSFVDDYIWFWLYV